VAAIALLSLKPSWWPICVIDRDISASKVLARSMRRSM